MNGINPRQMRAVTHYDVSRAAMRHCHRGHFRSLSAKLIVHARLPASNVQHARCSHHLSQPAQAARVFLRRGIHA